MEETKKQLSSVSLVWATPNGDQLIEDMARVSNLNPTQTSKNLIAYLIKHKHWSPFEMCNMCVEIYTPRDISRQLLRHRFAFQEFSQRYASAAISGLIPFEKVFKVTENDDTPISNLYYNGVILTKKYDGIMITPVLVTDAVVFKSKRSFLSEVANTANSTESNKLKEFCTTLLVQGITPIFEFNNPYRQIVNDHGSQPQFILSGARRIADGKYVDIDELVLNIISSYAGNPVL